MSNLPFHSIVPIAPRLETTSLLQPSHYKVISINSSLCSNRHVSAQSSYISTPYVLPQMTSIPPYLLPPHQKLVFFVSVRYGVKQIMTLLEMLLSIFIPMDLPFLVRHLYKVCVQKL